MRWFTQGDLGWNIWPFNLRCAATRGSSAFLALEPQPAGEKDISTCWGRVGGLITGGEKKKRNRSGESELLFPMNEKRPCCALGVLPEVTPIWPESHAFSQRGLISIDASKTQQRRRSDLPFPLYLSRSPGNKTKICCNNLSKYHWQKSPSKKFGSS